MKKTFKLMAGAVRGLCGSIIGGIVIFITFMILAAVQLLRTIRYGWLRLCAEITERYSDERYINTKFNEALRCIAEDDESNARKIIRLEIEE